MQQMIRRAVVVLILLSVGAVGWAQMEASDVVGTWSYRILILADTTDEQPQFDTIGYTSEVDFRADGTGVERVGADQMEFTWELVGGNILEMIADGSEVYMFIHPESEQMFYAAVWNPEYSDEMGFTSYTRVE